MFNLFKKLCCTLLVLALIASLPVALGEAAAVEEESDLIDLFKMEGVDLSEPNFEGYEYEYVSEDGTESRYYTSYLLEIDGLKRTKNKREITNLFSSYVEDYAFEGDYCYLYLNMDWGYLVPLFSKEINVTVRGVEYKRTNMITTCTQEQIDILLDTGTFRLTDNSMRIINVLSNKRKREGCIGFGIMKPLELTEDTLSGMLDYLNQEDRAYNASYDGYLISPYFAAVSASFLNNTDEEKIMGLRRIREGQDE